VIELQPQHWMAVNAISLEELRLRNIKIAKEVGHIDGILGQNFLRYFASVRIDYKASVIEFEK